MLQLSSRPHTFVVRAQEGQLQAVSGSGEWREVPMDSVEELEKLL